MRRKVSEDGSDTGIAEVIEIAVDRVVAVTSGTMKVGLLIHLTFIGHSLCQFLCALDIGIIVEEGIAELIGC